MNLIQLEKIDTINEYGGTVFLIHANFGFFRLKPGERIIPGAHKHPEILYIVKREVTFVANEDGEELTAEKGNIVSGGQGDTARHFGSSFEQTRVHNMVLLPSRLNPDEV